MTISHSARSLLLAVGLASLGACLLDDDPPPVNPGKPPGCGDKICDITKESCTNCPEDCDCCALVYGAGIISGQALDAAQVAQIVGQPDSQTLPVDGMTELELTIGGAWYDATGAGPDFAIHGSVSTSQEPNSGCNTSGGSGGFEIWGKKLTGAYKLIGVWTGASTRFNISCTQLSEVRMLRLRGQPGALGQLDAISAEPGACVTGAGVP